MNSKISFYSVKKGYGKIINPEAPSNQERDIFFHISNVEGPLLKLLVLDKGVGLPVSFNIVDSTKIKDGKEAVNLTLDLEKRLLGVVKDFDNQLGHGHIEDFPSKVNYWFHYSFVIGSEEKFIHIEKGEPVLFCPEKTDKGIQANNILKVDDRNFIQRFADFDNYELAIGDLARMSPEEWDYITTKTFRNPILYSYLNQTCMRIIGQDKLKKDKSESGEEYSYFNTGLVTPNQDEIYVYFIQNPDILSENDKWLPRPYWKFLEFNTEESKFRKYFGGDDAQIATYFTEAQITDLLLDTSIKILPEWTHLLERKKRIEVTEINSLEDEEFKDKILEAINLAIKRVKRNYKTAIPHFYNQKIQLLLPLCFKPNKAKAVAALVIEKNEKIYSAYTILTIDQAYNNARLLAKPDREWLNP